MLFASKTVEYWCGGRQATNFGDEKMNGFDEWATDPENKGVYPRGEQKEEIDLRFVKEEDEEIESLISSEENGDYYGLVL